MMKLQKATLQEIYEEVQKVAGHLVANNSNWQAKIRQTLQKHYTNVERGVWAV
jgi:FtsZ-binding cell division protein ZapB